MLGHRAILNLSFPASSLPAIHYGSASGTANMNMAIELEKVNTPQDALALVVTQSLVGLHTAVVAVDVDTRTAEQKTEQFKNLLSQLIIQLQTVESGLTTETFAPERPEA